MTKLRLCWIYRITNVLNGDVYIGKTTKPDPFRRWDEHVRDLERGKHGNRYMQRDHDDGAVWTFDLIDVIENSWKGPLRLEARWMRHHRSEGITLYNMVPHRGRYGGRRKVRHP